MRQGLSREEALGISYEEMQLRLRQARFETQRESLTNLLIRKQTNPPVMADQKGINAFNKELQMLEQRINAVEMAFYEEIE